MVDASRSKGAARLTLRLPRLDEEAEFQRALAATPGATLDFMQFHRQGMSLPEYLAVLGDARAGVGLPPGFVATTFLLAFDRERIVGRLSLRHELNAFLAHEGGHIGYAVVPEFRNRGFATQILQQGIVLAARELGLRALLLTCDEGNIASAKVIERNGGVLENVVASATPGIRKRRYWIQVPARARVGLP